MYTSANVALWSRCRSAGAVPAWQTATCRTEQDRPLIEPALGLHSSRIWSLKSLCTQASASLAVYRTVLSHTQLQARTAT